MGKILLTERQYRIIQENIIMEDADSEQKMKKFLSELKASFIDTMKSGHIGDYVTFTFCQIADDGSWDSDTMSIITFKILESDGYEIKLEFVTSEGVPTPINDFGKKSLFKMMPKGVSGITFRNKKASVGFIPVKGEKENGKVINIPDFTAFNITDKNVRMNSIKASEESYNKWMAANEKFNKSMNYEPGFLGMNNFFFFPKGYIAMDDTLDKFGLSVKDAKGYDISIRIKEKGGIQADGERLESNTIYKGLYTGNKIIISGSDIDFIFYPGNQKIGTGGDFMFSASYKDSEGNEHPLNMDDSKVKVNIVKL